MTDILTLAIQRLNSNPYSLTKSECISVLEELRAALAQPEQQAPVTVNNAMVDAYLKANDAYWHKTDGLPQTPGKWRNGTPYEATRVSLIAALESAHPPAQPQELCEQVNSGVRCGVPRKAGERLCPDCNPQPASTGKDCLSVPRELLERLSAAMSRLGWTHDDEELMDAVGALLAGKA